MKTGGIVGLTVAAVGGFVLLACVVMWSHMKTHAAAGHGRHIAQQTSAMKS